MKFFATIVASGVLVSATYQEVVNDFATIQSQTNTLDSAIKAYQSAGDLQSVVDKSNAVVSSINKGTSDANNSPDFSTIQGAQLVQPVQSLANTVDTTINDLINKKSLVVSTCAGPTTYKSLIQQQSAAKAFSAAVVAKVPADLQTTANQLASQITDAIAKGVSTYADAQSLPASCTGSGSGPSTTAASGGSSSSAPAGSSSAPAASSSVPSYGSGSAPTYGNDTTVSSVVYTTTTVCPLTMTSAGSTITSLTTSVITVTSCAGGCSYPASSAPAKTYPASSAPAQTYPAQTHATGTGASYPTSTLPAYTGSASRSQLSAAIVAMIPLAFFL